MLGQNTYCPCFALNCGITQEKRTFNLSQLLGELIHISLTVKPDRQSPLTFHTSIQNRIWVVSPAIFTSSSVTACATTESRFEPV
uniref:Uncharacterized protein n=1 Tax=Oryza brachyantha TaxID=4533 RepID=J3MLW7_ORYBR